MKKQTGGIKMDKKIISLVKAVQKKDNKYLTIKNVCKIEDGYVEILGSRETLKIRHNSDRTGFFDIDLLLDGVEAEIKEEVDFPEYVGSMGDTIESVKVDPVLKQFFIDAIPFVNEDEKRVSLFGIKISPDGRIAATDGFSGLTRFHSALENWDILIPMMPKDKKIWNSILKLDNLKMRVIENKSTDANFLTVENDDFIYTTLLADDCQFPLLEKIIPESWEEYGTYSQYHIPKTIVKAIMKKNKESVLHIHPDCIEYLDKNDKVYKIECESGVDFTFAFSVRLLNRVSAFSDYLNITKENKIFYVEKKDTLLLAMPCVYREFKA